MLPLFLLTRIVLGQRTSSVEFSPQFHARFAFEKDEIVFDYEVISIQCKTGLQCGIGWNYQNVEKVPMMFSQVLHGDVQVSTALRYNNTISYHEQDCYKVRRAEIRQDGFSVSFGYKLRSCYFGFHQDQIYDIMWQTQDHYGLNSNNGSLLLNEAKPVYAEGVKKEELLPDKFVELQLDENVTLSYNLYGGFITLKVTCKGVDDCGVSIGELLENYQFEANELYSLHLENDITPTLKKDSYYDIYWFSQGEQLKKGKGSFLLTSIQQDLVYHDFTYSNSTFISVKINSTISLGWMINGSTVTFQVTCNIMGYCGIGWGSTSMGQTPMMITTIDNDKATVGAYRADGHDVSNKQDDPTLFTNITSQIKNNGYVVTATRALNSTNHYNLVPDSKFNIIWAYHSGNQIEFHSSDYGNGLLSFSTVQNGASFLGGSNGDNKQKTHGQAMTIMWLVISGIMIFLGRYLRWLSYAVILHVLSGICVMSVTIWSVNQMYDQFPLDISGDSDYKRHATLGALIFIFVIVQATFGIITGMLMVFGRKVQKLTWFSKWTHRILGWASFLCAVTNVWYGWDLYDGSGWKDLAEGLIIALCVVFTIAEIRSLPGILFPWIKVLDCRRRPERKYTHQEILAKLKSSNEKLAFCDDLVINYKHFYLYHPGGKFMLEDAQGQDLGKYLHGSSSYNGDYRPHEHSLKTQDYINFMSIGKIPYPVGAITPVESNSDFSSMVWRVAETIKVAKNTFKILLKSDQFRISDKPQLEWIGKHYQVIVRNTIGMTRRYYSALFTNLKEWGREIEQFQGNSIQSSIVNDHCNGFTPLQIIVKAYENGKVSSWLKSRKDNEIVELKGVLGPGLLLDGSFNGNVVAFAAGTGLIPFLDLVYFIWRQEVTGNKTNNINLILHAKFSGKDFVFAADLLKECERMVGNSQILKIVLTEGDGSTRNDKRSVNLGDEFLLNDPTYIYICGPSGYNYYMKEKLLSRNVPRHKLVILWKLG